jgi:hypothetical protein
VVPFLHVTTHIPDHPYDTLLTEMGGTGFPTLMFLDADGRRLQTHRGPRTPQAFEDTLEAVQEFQELMAKAEAGDATAKVGVFIRQLQLEWFDFDQAKKAFEALGDVPSKQKETIEQLLVDTEVRTLIANARNDVAKLKEASKRFLEMWNEELVPKAEAQAYAFWSVLASHAEDAGDKKLFKKVVDKFKDTLQDPRYGRALRALEERLKNFKKK